MVRIAGAWKEGYRVVASDSQAAIKRCLNLVSGVQKGGSWIDEEILRLAGGGGRSLVWVKGHSGVEGNEEANRRAKDAVMRGQWWSEPSLATPAGIKQAYPLYNRLPHMKWNRDELRGLTYLHTDKGPVRAWLHKFRGAEDPFCVPGETQNAAHLMEGGCVGGKRRK